MLQDIVDPDNKKAQAYFERQKKKTERNATVPASGQRNIDKRIKKLQTEQQLEDAESKYRPGIEEVIPSAKKVVEKRNRFPRISLK